MTPSNPSAAELRRRAEARLSEKQKSQRSQAGAQRTAPDTLRLIEELQIHQIELEMQNEQLEQARATTEAALERYTDLYDFAPAGYFTLDRNETIRQANLTGSELLGVNRSMLVNRRFGLFVAENSRPDFRAFAEKVFASQSQEACEALLLREGKSPFHARIEARTFADGQECRFVVTDITERKRAEEALREREAELKEAQRVVEVGNWNWLAQSDIFTCSEEFCRIAGRDPEQPTPHYKDGQKIFTPESWASLEPAVQRTLRTGMPYVLDLEIVRPDGRRRWINVRGEAMTNAAEEIVGLRGTAQDITERKRQEAILQKQAELLDLAHDAIFAADRDDRITYWNLGAKQRYGWSPEEALGKNAHTFLLTVFPQPLGEIKAILLKEGYWEGELSHATRDGSRIIVASRWSLQRDKHGNPAGFLEVNNDITEQSQAEEALRERDTELREAQRITKVGNWKLEGETVTWSEEMFRIFGRDPMLPPPSYSEHPEILTPESWARLQVIIENATKTGTPYEMNLEIVCPDGTRKWIIARGEAVRNEEGRITALRGTAQDITERMRSEQALRLQAKLFDQTYDAIIVWDWDGPITFWNRGAERLYGFSGRGGRGSGGQPIAAHKVCRRLGSGLATFGGPWLVGRRTGAHRARWSMYHSREPHGAGPRGGTHLRARDQPRYHGAQAGGRGNSATER